MTQRSFPIVKLFTTIALIAMALPSHAAVIGKNSTNNSFGGTASTEDLRAYESFTKQDLADLREQRNEARKKLEKLEDDIAAMEKKLAEKDKSATQAKLDKLKQEKADLEEFIAAVNDLILQAIADLKGNTTNTGTNTGSNNTGGSGGSGGGGSQIGQQIMGMLQGMLGGNNSALNGLMNGGLGNGMPVSTGGGTGQQQQEDPYAGLPPCGTTEGEEGKAKDDKLKDDKTTKDTDTQTSGSGVTKTVGDFGMHASRDRPSDGKPETRDDSGKLKKDDKDKDKKDEKDKEKDKPKCRPVQVNTPNPTSGDGTQSRKITSIEDAQKFVGQYLCDPSNSDCRSPLAGGNGQQCASLTKFFCPEVGGAGSWNGGSVVKGNNLAIGTCIATFSQNGNYGPAGSPGGASGKSHTGVYLGQNSAGIIMLHQWNGSGGARISTVPWSAWGRNQYQGGNMYKTIASINVFKGIDWFLPTITIAFNIPLGEGLAKDAPHAYNEIQG